MVIPVFNVTNLKKKSSFSNKKETVIVPLIGQVTYGLYIKDYTSITGCSYAYSHIHTSHVFWFVTAKVTIWPHWINRQFS